MSTLSFLRRSSLIVFIGILFAFVLSGGYQAVAYDGQAAAVLDLNRRLADSSITLVALLELLHDANVLTSEEFESYQASVALRTSGLKSFDIRSKDG